MSLLPTNFWIRTRRYAKKQNCKSIWWEILQQYCSNILNITNKCTLNVIFKFNYLNTFAIPKALKLSDAHLLNILLNHCLQQWPCTIRYGKLSKLRVRWIFFLGWLITEVQQLFLSGYCKLPMPQKAHIYWQTLPLLLTFLFLLNSLTPLRLPGRLNLKYVENATSNSTSEN